ncbi:MAG: MFS transporter [Candidatus Methanomethyliaceae archaeon]|nr:MFS transporter [Candidatus Methanomethyliaceae archaeon]
MISYAWRLNIAAMLFFTFVQVVVPLIPRYAVVIGAQPFLIGLAISSISIAAIITRPIGGILSDKWSRRKLMIIGTIFASIAYFILSISNDVNTIIISRILEGIGVALFVPSSIASAIDYAPEGRIGEALGWRSLMIGIGFSIGPALGGILSELLGYIRTFIIASILLIGILPLIISREMEPHYSSSKMSFSGLRDMRFILALMSLIIHSVAWMGVLTFLSAYLKILGYGDLEIGLFVTIQASISLIIRVFAGRASDIRPFFTTALGLLIISISYFAIYILEVPPLLYFASLIFGIGIGIFIPSSQTLALAHASSNSRGFLSSIYTMGMDVGNLIGPITLGAIIERHGYRLGFSIVPFLPLTSSILLFLYGLMKSRKD